MSAFLSHLAVDRHVAASTQNQAFSAAPFLDGPHRLLAFCPVELLISPQGWMEWFGAAP
jgi:hypothetical protein